MGGLGEGVEEAHLLIVDVEDGRDALGVGSLRRLGQALLHVLVAGVAAAKLALVLVSVAWSTFR